jgi:capsule biosynthesis phosphatase
MKTYCFDIDGVVFEISNQYKDYTVIETTKRLIKKLKVEGNKVVLYTARKMKTHDGCIGKINKDIVEETLYQLRVNDIFYDEIYFGKPAADYYIDDKAVNFYDLKEHLNMSQDNQQEPVSLGIISYRLGEMERNFEKSMERISEKIDDLIAKHGVNEIAQRELSVKVENLEGEIRSLKENERRLQEEVNQVKISLAEKLGYGALGGGLITVISRLLGA